MTNTASGELNFMSLSYYRRMAVLAVAMKGYGYSASFAGYFERPIKCSLSDMNKVVIKANCYSLFIFLNSIYRTVV